MTKTDTDTKQILIIEDEFPMRYLIEYQLKHNGFEVNLAKDGPSGLKAIALDKPDLVLLDVMMPGMDGFDVCKEIKSNPETADIPVIFVTASEIHHNREKAFDLGAAEYMTKPFRPEQLMAQITAVLNRNEALYDDVYSYDESVAEEDDTIVKSGQVITLFSPKGGVGTTTLSVQLAEAITLEAERPVVLIDLDLPFGGVAPMLRMFPRHDILELISIQPDYITLSIIDEFAQRHRDNLFVIPAPGRLVDPDSQPNFEAFQATIAVLVEDGYDVIIDLGSQLTPFSKKVLQLSDTIYLITSGQAHCNQLVDAFVKSADEIGLDPRKILPVINELYGSVNDISLTRVPVARIPFTGEPTNTRIFLREQGMRKMVSMLH